MVQDELIPWRSWRPLLPYSIDRTGNHYGTVETGEAELTIECGSIFG